jgi:ethanolamine utilization protein EutA
VENGHVIETAAVYVGGRLLVVDENQRIVRFDPGGKYISEQLGFSWQIGDTVKREELEQMTSWMADAILTAIQQRPLPAEIEQLYLTPVLQHIDYIDGVMFSGGVGEYVYDREEREFGDLGKLLGHSLRKKIEAGQLPWPLLPAGECIRATVVGASEYSVQVSGNTIYISDANVLPIKDLQVLHPEYVLKAPIDSEKLALAIRQRFVKFDLLEGEANVVLAFRWYGDPAYSRVAAFVKGIVRGMELTIKNGKAIVLVLDGDIARTVGEILKEEHKIKSDIISIDGILLQDFDFIDIGQIMYPSGTVPVTIKSLIFKL